MNGLAQLLLASALVATSAPTLAQDRPRRYTPDWRLYLSSGLSYTQRDNAEDRKTHFYRIPLAARFARGPIRVTASVPYLIVDGPASNLGDDDSAGDDLPSSDTRENRRGFGDLSITGRYRAVDDKRSGIELDLMSRVKLPTASRRKRLGSGEVDYAVGAQLSREMGKLRPFVSAQYRINGDPPDRDYRNSVATSVGTSVRLSRGTRASLAWDYTQSRIRGRSASHMLDGGLTRVLRPGLTLSGDAAVGLSRNAPHFRVGATLTARAF